jgi:hypothetical protein
LPSSTNKPRTAANDAKSRGEAFMHFLLGSIPGIVACYLLHNENVYVFYFSILSLAVYFFSSMSIIVEAFRICMGKETSKQTLEIACGFDLTASISIIALIVNCTLMTVGLLLKI